MYSSNHGETFNCPVEIAEARYGFSFHRFALSDEPGGDGLHHGGPGMLIEYAIGGSETSLSAGYTPQQGSGLGPRRRRARHHQPHRG